MRVYNRDTNKICELDDALMDVLKGCNQRDNWLVPDGVDADFAMSGKEVADWTLWARNERRIDEIYAAADEETRELIAVTYSDADWDMWLPQHRVFDALGIEWNEEE